MFRVSIELISGVHKTAVAASGTDRTFWGASFLKRDQIWTQSLFGRAVIKTALVFAYFLNEKKVSSQF